MSKRQRVPRFTQALKDKWLKALRSGRYKQGTGWLHDSPSNTYCCLGVLCAVAGFKSVSYDYITGLEPNDDSLYQILSERRQRILARQNDNGKTFKQIAAYIKKNVPAKR